MSIVSSDKQYNFFLRMVLCWSLVYEKINTKKVLDLLNEFIKGAKIEWGWILLPSPSFKKINQTSKI